MSAFLVLAFLFFIGSVFGWMLEVVFRKFFSGGNPEHRWVNPGFLSGPYLPLYGTGLVILFLLASLESRISIDNPIAAKLILFAAMAVCMTAIEYIAGIGCLKLAHIRLWDYSNNWGNFQGLICPLFSFFWTVLGAVYYFLIHPHILDALQWLSNNLAFSFFIGFFYGVFVLDLIKTTQIAITIRRFADEQQIIVRYEDLKERIREYNISRFLRARFIFNLRTEIPLRDFLRENYRHRLQDADKIRSKINQIRKK